MASHIVIVTTEEIKTEAKEVQTMGKMANGILSGRRNTSRITIVMPLTSFFSFFKVWKIFSRFAKYNRFAIGEQRLWYFKTEDF